MALTNTEIEHLLYREMRSLIPLGRIETVGAAEGDIITLEDGKWRPRPGFGTGTAGTVELLPLSLVSGVEDDYAYIHLGDETVITVEIWIPDHRTGEPFHVRQQMVQEDGERKLRISVKKNLVPSKYVEAVVRKFIPP